MQPAKIDPVEYARQIVYAHASGTFDAARTDGFASLGTMTTTEELERLAGSSAQPFFSPNIPVVALCVLLSVAIVAWSVASP